MSTQISGSTGIISSTDSLIKITFSDSSSLSSAANLLTKPSSPSPGQVLSYDLLSNSWVAKSVSLNAGGDLAGTLSNATVTKLQGKTISTADPTTGQVLTYTGSTWEASNPSGGADNTPIGTIMWFSANAAPVGYLECNGEVLSRSQYSDLFAVIGTTFNTGLEGIANFRLPDLRGEFVRGWDHTKGVDSGRTFGSNQADEFKSHKHSFDIRYSIQSGGSEMPPLDATNGYGTYDTSFTGGTETRPRNIALLPCIKAIKTGILSSLNFIEKPASAAIGDVVTYDGTAWIASAANIGGGIKIFDTPGANQSWTCPPGVYSVKITVIGAGGVSELGNGGVSSCSIGGVTVTATGGGANGYGGGVPAVLGYVGAGTGGNPYANYKNGTGGNGGYGGGAGNIDNAPNEASGTVVGGGCGMGEPGPGVSGGGYAGSYGGGYGWGGGAYGYDGALLVGGGGGGYAVYKVDTTPGAYTNAINVGAAPINSNVSFRVAGGGAVIIEW